MASAPTTYDELKERILDADAIPDSSDYASNTDLFIDLAEARMNTQLRTRRQLVTSTLSMDSSGEASLPSDFLALQRATAVEGSFRYPLIEASPGWLDDEFPNAYSGWGQYVTIDGDTVRVRPITGTVDFRYYQAIPALTDANPTNWVLTYHPGLYLAAALFEAAVWYGDETGQALYSQKMADQFAQVKQRDLSSRLINRRISVKGHTP